MRGKKKDNLNKVYFESKQTKGGKVMNYMHRKNIALLAVLLILVLSTAAFADSIIIKASASPKKGGTISPSGKVAVNPGENLQFTITPNTGYQIKDVVVDGVSQGATNVYTFANITEKHSLKAKFAKKTFTVEIADGGKVSVSPVGTKTVTYDKKITLKIKPESEDVVPILLVNGKPVEAKKSGNVYNYVLTPVGDTSVYATSEVEPKLTPGTKIMDEVTANNLISISEDGTVLTFTGVTPYLESLQPDDVMVSTFATDVTPYGLLRKVTNVVIDDPQVTVETTDATVEDVLEEGEIIVNKALTAYDITSFVPLVEGVTLQEAIPGPIHQQGCLTLNKVLYDADGNNNTTNDQVVLNGSACLDPSYHFSLGMGWKHKWGIPYPAVKNLVFAVGLSESIALELDAHYTQTFSKEIPIAVIGYGAIVVGPLVFIPVQTVYVGIDGSISAGITAGINQYAGLELGLSYHNSKWAAIANVTSGFDYHLPVLNYLDAQVEVYAGSEFRFMLYGVAGSYVNLTGYFDLEMGSFSNQWLNIFAGIKAGAGFKAGIWGFEIKKDWPNLFNHYELLAQQYAAINQPPTITSLTANPSNVLISKTSTITVVASDLDGDPLTCAWSKDGGTLSSTTGCGSVTWTAPATPGTYTVSISITDNKAGHSPVTQAVTITVLPNQPPTITSLTANPSNVLISKTSTITVVASDPDGDPLTCAWSKDGGTLSSTTGCGSVTWTAPATPGTYAVYVSVTDNKEGHSPITWAATIPVTAEPICVPRLSSPANGAVLDNGCSDNIVELLRWNFAWTACSGATQYKIYVKHPDAANARVDTTVDGTNYSYEEPILRRSPIWLALEGKSHGQWALG